MTLELNGVDFLVANAVLQGIDVRVGDEGSERTVSGGDDFVQPLPLVKRTIGRPLAITSAPTRRNS